MTLRWRWALSLGGATALVSLVALIAFSALTVQELREGIDQDLRQRLELAQLDPPGAGPRAPFEGLRRRAPVNLDALYQVIGPEGQIVVASDPLLPVTPSTREIAAAESAAPLLETVDVDGTTHRMIVGKIPPGRLVVPHLTAQIAVPIEQLDNSVRALVGRSVLIGALLIVVAAATGWALASRTVAPIEELTEEVERISRTRDLATSIASPRSDEVGRLARSFGAMVTSLRRSRDQQQRLIADAGHEFRTPLTALRTNLETLQRRREELTEEQVATLIDAAAAETLELSALATELVDLAQDAESSTEPLLDVALDELVRLVVRRFESRTDQDIVVTGSGSVVSVRPGQIERALANILANAIVWNDPSEPIEVTVDGGRVSVRDHGPGIDQADLAHVFERFHRSDRARAHPGSGLGLSIVEHVVTGHSGTVHAENHPEGGAIVGFELPDATVGG